MATIRDTTRTERLSHLLGAWWPLAILRIFFGVVYLPNGISKLVPGFRTFDLGPAHSYLVDLAGTRQIISADAHTSIAPYRWFIDNIVLTHFNLFGHLVGVAEVAVGLGLITGVLGRSAALGGMLLALNLQIAALGDGEFLFEYAVEWVPLLLLAFMPTGHLPVLERVAPLRRLLSPGISSQPVLGPLPARS
jgi:uncharacterized membrane protein YphA (DoxX/SURF4 family)